MKAFERVRSVAVPLPRANVDTDQILPMPFLQKPRSDNFGHYLFHAIRRDAQGGLREDFVFNHPRYAQARMVVAGPNFGCGSSREHAVWALADAGFEVVIAPSFGDIFYGNCLKNGVLPVRLAGEHIEFLLQHLADNPETMIQVDLELQTVQAANALFDFDIDPFAKHCLLKGLDQIDYTLSLLTDIEAYEQRTPS
jgi:3-isopropylmalate/(R)-2-methylmalate dehydratase small subunit